MNYALWMSVTICVFCASQNCSEPIRRMPPRKGVRLTSCNITLGVSIWICFPTNYFLTYF
jgi:hypothetical protein